MKINKNRQNRKIQKLTTNMKAIYKILISKFMIYQNSDCLNI